MRHISCAASTAIFLGSLTLAFAAMAQPVLHGNMSGNASAGTSMGTSGMNGSASMGTSARTSNMNAGASTNAQSGVAVTPPVTPPADTDDNTNRNGKTAMDRDKGQARAEDRRNDRDADDRQVNARKDADDRAADAGKDADDRGNPDKDDRGADKR